MIASCSAILQTSLPTCPVGQDAGFDQDRDASRTSARPSSAGAAAMSSANSAASEGDRRGSEASRLGSHYVSSTLSFLPTADAARSSVESVTERFVGSSRRSTAGLLVFMRCAISDLVSRARLIS